MATQQLIRVDVNAQVQWQIAQAKGGNWVAVCDTLKLTVQAENWAELMEDIGIVLDALLRDLLESNELPRFLNDHGWKLAVPVPSHTEDVRFEVPFLTAMMSPHGSARRLHQ